MSEHDENGAETTLESQEELDSQTNGDEVVEDIEEIKAELAKAKELANNYKIRAEKAEKAKAPVAPSKPVAPAATINMQDVLALNRAGIEPEDVEIVENYAKYKGISIAEALNTTAVKAELAEKKEQRASAAAANVGVVKRGSSKTSDEALLSRVQKGELPDSLADAERLYKIRKGLI